MRYYSNSLYHYGIKGQKWGVRRFQEEDGTLTFAGKERYGSTNSKSRANSDTRSGLGIAVAAAPSVSIIAARSIRSKVNRNKVRKEVDDSGVNTDKRKRIKDEDITKSLASYNKKDRKEILNRMQNNKNLSYLQAETPVALKRTVKNMALTAAFLTSAILAPKVLSKVTSSPAFMSFMKSVKRRKVNGISLKKSEYKIFDNDKLMG